MNTVISEEHLDLSFGDIEVAEPDAVSISVGERSLQLFFNPNNFPLPFDGDYINLCIEYRSTAEIMTVQLAEAECSIETTAMNNWQKSVAFLYLVGSILHD